MLSSDVGCVKSSFNERSHCFFQFSIVISLKRSMRHFFSVKDLRSERFFFVNPYIEEVESCYIPVCAREENHILSFLLFYTYSCNGSR